MSITNNRDYIVYVLLISLIVCGQASSLVTGGKLVHVGVDFPFSNITFSLFTYPLIDCICEIWGKRPAKVAMYIGLFSQLLIALLIQLSIAMPATPGWQHQDMYASILSVTGYVMVAGFAAFTVSLFIDILIYQKIKKITGIKWLWLRSLVSTGIGQSIDSIIFVSIVFYQSGNLFHLISGSIILKLFLSILIVPIYYFIVWAARSYISSNKIILAS